MTRRVKIVLVVLAGFLITSCTGPHYTYRYKLTLEAEVDGEIKRAFNVVEHLFAMDYMKNVGDRAFGDALFMDLGPQRRPLIALLGRQPRERRRGDSECEWGLSGIDMYCLERLYDLKVLDFDYDNRTLKGFDTFRRQRGPKEITSNDLPDLVTFEHVAVPGSVLAVDPKDPGKALNCNFRWRRITIEITDEPVTRGIEKRLSWLSDQGGALNGSKVFGPDRGAHPERYLTQGAFYAGKNLK